MALAFALVVVGSAGCHGKPTQRLKVAVSIFPIYDLVRRVAGPDADVVLVAPPGTLDRGDAESLSAARVVVMVGLGLDPWMGALAATSAPKARILKVGDRVPTLSTTGQPFVAADDGGSLGTVDPHVWLDPQRASVMTKAIGEELARADAAHAGAYRARADDVTDALDVLDRDLAAKTAGWQGRTVVTVPGGFAYFADRYHLHTVALDPSATAGSAPIDIVGGGAGTDSYEKLLQHVVGELGKTIR